MPSGWRAITTDDIKTRLSASELDSFRTAAVDSGDVDTVQGVVDSVTETVRGFISGCPQNILANDGFLPTSLIGPALDIIALTITSRAAGLILDPDGQRRKAADQAYLILRDVSACRFKIPRPGVSDGGLPSTQPSTVQPGYVPPSIHNPRGGRRTQFGKDSQNGI